jgi:hypothetical protein
MVSLSKIRDNPWRDRVRNPIVPERVESIATSINKTGKYWLGTYGRDAEDGFVELAFGHHRYEAAKAQGLEEIPITIEAFTDGEMLVWMAQENVRGELPVVIEAVSAAVKALGEGKIKIEAPDPSTRKNNIRYAPSFIAGGPVPTVGTGAYTAEALAIYLGFIKKATGKAKDSVYAAMGILERAEIARLEEGKDEKKGVEKALRVEKSFTGPSADELAKMKVNVALKELSDINGREAKRKERAERSAEEIRIAEDAKQAASQKLKDDAAAAKKERDELLRKQVEALAEENDKAAKRIQKEIKDKAIAAEAKAEADKAKLKVLDKNLEEKKAAAEEQRKVDEYLPIRRETDRIIHILERRDLKDDLQALSHRQLSLKDRERVWQAIDNLSAWLSTWAAAQFSNTPIPKSKGRK